MNCTDGNKGGTLFFIIYLKCFLCNYFLLLWRLGDIFGFGSKAIPVLVLVQVVTLKLFLFPCFVTNVLIPNIDPGVFMVLGNIILFFLPLNFLSSLAVVVSRALTLVDRHTAG